MFKKFCVFDLLTCPAGDQAIATSTPDSSSRTNKCQQIGDKMAAITIVTVIYIYIVYLHKPVYSIEYILYIASIANHLSARGLLVSAHLNMS